MEELLTDRAKRIMAFAREEAAKRGTDRIEPLHVLMAMLRPDRRWMYPNSAMLILLKKGIATDQLRQTIELQIERGGIQSKTRDVTLQPDERTLLVLKRAYDEVQRRENQHLGVEYLLLGLLQDTTVARMLPSVTLDDIREEVRILRP